MRTLAALSLTALLAAVSLVALGCTRHAAPAVTIQVKMRKYAIEPKEIHLKLGQPVRFVVSSADVQHGFSVPGLDIREAVAPGKPADFDFTPDKKGVFEMKCGIICGPGHDQMTGRIVVE